MSDPAVPSIADHPHAAPPPRAAWLEVARVLATLTVVVMHIPYGAAVGGAALNWHSPLFLSARIYFFFFLSGFLVGARGPAAGQREAAGRRARLGGWLGISNRNVLIEDGWLGGWLRRWLGGWLGLWFDTRRAWRLAVPYCIWGVALTAAIAGLSPELRAAFWAPGPPGSTDALAARLYPLAVWRMLEPWGNPPLWFLRDLLLLALLTPPCLRHPRGTLWMGLGVCLLADVFPTGPLQLPVEWLRLPMAWGFYWIGLGLGGGLAPTLAKMDSSESIKSIGSPPSPEPLEPPKPSKPPPSPPSPEPLEWLRGIVRRVGPVAFLLTALLSAGALWTGRPLLETNWFLALPHARSYGFLPTALGVLSIFYAGSWLDDRAPRWAQRLAPLGRSSFLVYVAHWLVLTLLATGAGWIANLHPLTPGDTPAPWNGAGGGALSWVWDGAAVLVAALVYLALHGVYRLMERWLPGVLPWVALRRARRR